MLMLVIIQKNGTLIHTKEVNKYCTLAKSNSRLKFDWPKN